MLSKKDKKQVYRLSTKDQISLFPPTERTILWIIAKNPETFTISFLLEVGHEVAVNGPKPESNLAKAMAITVSLQQRRYIKIGAFKTTITLKGQWFRIYSHPASAVIGIIIGTIIAISAIAFPIIYASNVKPDTKEARPSEKSTKQPPAVDSLLYHQKSLKDSSKK
jgi:hypothetical protein